MYRAGDEDLTLALDLFNPIGSGGKEYPFGQVNELDLCLRLQQARQAPAGAAAAHVAGDAGAVLNIAYGVVAPGIDADSDGNLFDAANAGAVPRLERPDREPGPGYDDRVRVRDFDTLGMPCPAIWAWKACTPWRVPSAPPRRPCRSARRSPPTARS